MSQLSESDYNGPQPDRVENSVYDFFYHDSRRISSYLSQFETYGTPSSVKAAEKVSEGQSSSSGVAGKGKVPLIAEGSGKADWANTSTDENATERTFDPLWRNALTLLDYLSSSELINQSLYDARIGQFVLTTGSLAMFDMAHLKAAWENPVIGKMIEAGVAGEAPLNRQQKRAQDRSGKPDNSFKDGIFPLIKMLPHSIVASTETKEGTLWCNLSAENLIVPTSDILMKHGLVVPGYWSMLGILDAFPEDEITQGGYDPSEALNLAAANSLGLMGAMIGAYAPGIRAMLGRPRTAFGITPLLIFREIS